MPAQAIDCTFTRYRDNSRSLDWFVIGDSCRFAQAIDGVDAGTGASNSAILKIPMGKTLTVGAGDSLALGQLSLEGNAQDTNRGTLQINDGGTIHIGAPLYLSDEDDDDYIKSNERILSWSTPVGSIRLNNTSNITNFSIDCNDADNSLFTTCKPTFGLTERTGIFKSNFGLTPQESSKDPSLVGLWHLDEASGNAVDSSGNSLTGTATGTTVVEGVIKKARNFGAASNYIAVSDNAALDLPGTCSFSAWVYPTSFSECNTSADPYCILLNKESSYEFGFDSSGNFEWAITPSWVWVNTSVTIAPNVWTHLAVTYNGALVQVYKNGVLSHTSAKTGTPDNSSKSFRIGGREDISARFFPGSIDEVAIYNRTLSTDEILSLAGRRSSGLWISDVIDLGVSGLPTDSVLTALVQGQKTGDGETAFNNTGLIAQWNFNETSGLTASDYVSTQPTPTPIPCSGAGAVCVNNGDCCANNCTTFYQDGDSDTYGKSSVTTKQCGTTPPSGYVADNTDCCDTDNRVKPGQTTCYTTQSNCSSWDYDCVGGGTTCLTCYGTGGYGTVSYPYYGCNTNQRTDSSIAACGTSGATSTWSSSECYSPAACPITGNLIGACTVWAGSGCTQSCK